MATGENILWIIKKEQTSRPFGSDKPFAPIKHFVFRTREAATDFKDDRNALRRNKHMTYSGPIRATWGPEQ